MERRNKYAENKTAIQRCRHCDGLFRVRIYPTLENQRAFCPYCKTSHYYRQEYLQSRTKKPFKWIFGLRDFFKNFRRIRTRKYHSPISNQKFFTPKLRRLIYVSLAFGMASPILLLMSLDFPQIYLEKPYEAYFLQTPTVKPSIILDRNNQIIGEFIQQRRSNTKFAEIPKSLQEKIIFIEDRSFYKHRGLHLPSILRAFYSNVINLGYRQGGSTITQQLARILLSQREKKIMRKLKEGALARYLEKHFSKEDILREYINSVYLGHGAYGFSIAADFYFGKALNELTSAEEIILAALPSRPEILSPLRNPDLLTAKINLILREMIEHEQEVSLFIEAEIEQSIALFNQSPMTTVYSDTKDIAPQVTEHVRSFLKKHFAEEWSNQGLKIKTSIDKTMQEKSAQLTKAYVRGKRESFLPIKKFSSKKDSVDQKRIIKESNQYMAELIKNYPAYNLIDLVFGISSARIDYPRLQSAFVGLENKSGQVLFLVGGTEFSRYNQLNRAIDMRRQTGSSIKAIVYAAALEENIANSLTRLEDSPFYANGSENQPPWLPANYNQIFEGSLLLRDAFVRSKNIPAVRLAEKIGLANLEKHFASFFFPQTEIRENRFRSDLSIALGSLEMSPLEMASAYTAFANNGVIIRPNLIQSIHNEEGIEVYRSNQVDEFDLNISAIERKVISGDVAEIMNSYLQDSLRQGTSTISALGSQSLFGKTGTSNKSRDVWFVGGSPGLTMSLWLGFDDSQFSIQRGVGANLAKPLWDQVMETGMKYHAGSYYFEPRAVKRELCGSELFITSRENLADFERPYDFYGVKPEKEQCQQAIREELFRESSLADMNDDQKKQTDSRVISQGKTDNENQFH